jgi:hypothetical protein
VLLTTSMIARCLADEWHLPDVRLVQHHGGMNSQTWFVGRPGSSAATRDTGGTPRSDTHRGDTRWVAKAVPIARERPFVAGLATAARVEAAGIPAGAPVATRSGGLVVPIGDRVLALLSFVEGVELSGRDARERRLIGTTLAQAHRALVGIEVPGADRFHWVDPRADHLRAPDWLRPAVTDALAALDRLAPESLSWGMLHTDPAPEAFRLDARRGVCGLIDWDMGLFGPLLYDLASAVMYVGGPDEAEDLVGAYLAPEAEAPPPPVPAPEVARGLLPMLRFRWAVQADYFARRIATDDLTGIDSAADNEQGLEDARHWLGLLAGAG